MFKPLAQSFDWLLSMTLARMIRPRGDVPRGLDVPSDPAEVIWPELVEPSFSLADAAALKLTLAAGEELSEFSFDSPVDSPWAENQTVRGLALGAADAARAVILMHGAYEDTYQRSLRIARAFAQHGYRVLMPAGPCHLQRTPPGVFSGSPMFWSSELFTAALHQWLAELHGLIGYLHREGIGQVGVFGNSLGS